MARSWIAARSVYAHTRAACDDRLLTVASNAPLSWTTRPLTLALFSGGLGFVANAWSLSVFGETSLVFGGFFSLLSAFAFGPWLGALAAAIAFSRLAMDWAEAAPFVCFVGEAFCIGYLIWRRRWRTLPAVVGYWGVIGLPLAAAWTHLFADLPFPQNVAAPIAIGVNGPVMALAAISAQYLLSRHWPAIVPPIPRTPASLRTLLRQRFSVIASLPLVALGLLAGHKFDATRENEAIAREVEWAGRIARIVQKHVDEHRRVVSTLAWDLGAGHDRSLPALQRELDSIRREYPGFRSLAMAEPTGQVIAFLTPPGEPARPLETLPNISDRSYFREAIATRAAYVSDGLTGRLFHPSALVVVSAPVIGPHGGVEFVIAGALDLNQLVAAIQGSGIPGDRDVALLDRAGNLLFAGGRLAHLPALTLLPNATPANHAFIQPIREEGTSRDELFLCAGAEVPGLGWRVLSQEPVWVAQRSIAIFYFTTALWAALAIGIALLLAHDTANSVTQPLQQLLAWNRQLTDDPPLQPALPENAGVPREILQLGDDLHAAAQRARESHRELARSVEERDASNRRLRELLQSLDARVLERTTQLQHARAAAESASQAKTEFLASMSHELRTPLNVVLGMSEVLREQKLGALGERQIECIRSIEESGRHLLALINDILDLSKIEAGKLQLEAQQVSIREVCEASLRMVRETAQKKKLQLSVEYRQDCAAVTADPRRLKQILVNLLSNATKFTPEGGKGGILVTQNESPPAVVFQVWDTGIGISDDDQKKLFKPFVQIDSALSRRYSGTGLGLALVKRMAEMHRGTVTIDSTPDVGSRFNVTLPLAPEDLAGPRADDPRSAAPTAAPGSDQPFPGSPLLLIAEDNPDNIALIRYFAQMRGCRTVIARTGIEAVARARVDTPDIVLMDVNMPEMDGLEATRIISSDARTRHIPVICVTANAMAGDRQRCLSAGASAYLSKPVNLQELAAAIARLLPPPRPRTDAPPPIS